MDKLEKCARRGKNIAVCKGGVTGEVEVWVPGGGVGFVNLKSNRVRPKST